MWRARLWIPYSSMPIGLGILACNTSPSSSSWSPGASRRSGMPPKATADEIARAQVKEALGDML